MAVAFSALVMFVVIGAALSVLIYLPVLAVYESIPPRRARARAAVWFWALAIPVLASGVGTASGLWRVFHDRYGSPHLTAERPHLCARWLLEAPDARWSLAVVSVTGMALVVFALLRLAHGLVTSELTARRLRAAGALSGTGAEVLQVPAGEALAVTVGVLRPVTVVTTGLRASLEEPQWRAVMAHERAHLRARDSLWGAVATACASILAFAPTAHLYARYWRDEVEVACDREAAAATSVEAVASAMRELIASAGERQRRGLAGVSDHWTRSAAQVERRARELEGQSQEPVSPSPGSRWGVTVGVTVVAMVLGLLWWATGRQVSDTLYCMGESLLAVVGRH